MEQYKIEGHGDLARDPKTGAILNVNSLDYTHYTVGRNVKRSRNERVDSMENDLASLKGEIGDIHMIKITSRDPSPPPINYIKNSGGIFLDMTIHDFDMIRYLTNKEIVEVYAKGNALINPEIAQAGDIDTAIINLTFEDGSMAVIDNCRKAVY